MTHTYEQTSEQREGQSRPGSSASRTRTVWHRWWRVGTGAYFYHCSVDSTAQELLSILFYHFTPAHWTLVELTQNLVPVSDETSETNGGRTIPRMGRPGHCITGRYIRQLAGATKKPGFLKKPGFWLSEPYWRYGRAGGHAGPLLVLGDEAEVGLAVSLSLCVTRPDPAMRRSADRDGIRPGDRPSLPPR
jgi:hypothetical protein